MGDALFLLLYPISHHTPYNKSVGSSLEPKNPPLYPIKITSVLSPTITKGRDKNYKSVAYQMCMPFRIAPRKVKGFLSLPIVTIIFFHIGGKRKKNATWKPFIGLNCMDFLIQALNMEIFDETVVSGRKRCLANFLSYCYSNRSWLPKLERSNGMKKTGKKETGQN